MYRCSEMVAFIIHKTEVINKYKALLFESLKFKYREFHSDFMCHSVYGIRI
jgi:hypothetical protein